MKRKDGASTGRGSRKRKNRNVVVSFPKRRLGTSRMKRESRVFLTNVPKRSAFGRQVRIVSARKKTSALAATSAETRMFPVPRADERLSTEETETKGFCPVFAAGLEARRPRNEKRIAGLEFFCFNMVACVRGAYLARRLNSNERIHTGPSF